MSYSRYAERGCPFRLTAVEMERHAPMCPYQRPMPDLRIQMPQQQQYRVGQEELSSTAQDDLARAARDSRLDRVEDALSRGADPDGAMHDAAAYGNLDLVQLLVDRGARVDALDSRGRTAMHWAAKFGHVDVVKYCNCLKFLMFFYGFFS